MHKIIYALEADEDLSAIAEFTAGKFGVAQAIEYGSALESALELLASNPMMGSDQGTLRANTRRFVYQSHAIYYEVLDNEIVILRVLGPGQDPLNELV